nr:MAG TPA: nucelotide kinase [Bacteriophage sp.]
MNTNSKHYELLAIEPWDIMEANFPSEQFVAYLKGNIIKYTLRDKGQAVSDAQKIKHYAEKLVEVLKEQEKIEPMIVKDSKFKVGDRVRLLAYLTGATGTIIRQPVIGLREIDKENYIVELDEEEVEGWEANKREHLVDSERAWYVDDTEIELLKEEEPEPVEEPVGKHKFKVGDRVTVNDPSIHKKMKGTVIREPRNKQEGTEYLIELDEKEGIGWEATIAYHSVESKRAWYAVEADLELLEEETKKTLKPNQWYDAKDFTVEELEELLPRGTIVFVTYEHDNNRIVNLENEKLLSTTVKNIGARVISNDTRVGITGDIYWRRYFKIEGK